MALGLPATLVTPGSGPSVVSGWTGGPLKPGFGLSGDVQIPPILSSRREQIIAKAMICGVEGPAVLLARDASRSSRNKRYENTKEPGDGRPARPEKRLPHPSFRDGWVAMLMASVDFAPAHPSKSDGWGSLSYELKESTGGPAPTKMSRAAEVPRPGAR